MIRVNVGYSVYYVGSGKELIRLWKRALRHGFEDSLGHGELPKYNPAGTYALHFLSRVKKVYWANFKTIADIGEVHSDKKLPDYRQYKDVKLARVMYNYHNEK